MIWLSISEKISSVNPHFSALWYTNYHMHQLFILQQFTIIFYFSSFLYKFQHFMLHVSASVFHAFYFSITGVSLCISLFLFFLLLWTFLCQGLAHVFSSFYFTHRVSTYFGEVNLFSLTQKFSFVIFYIYPICYIFRCFFVWKFSFLNLINSVKWLM